MGDLLTSLVVCGLLGMVGQSTRAIVALSGSPRGGADAPSRRSQFSAAYLAVSLIVGFIAGVLAGLALGIIPTSSTPSAGLPDRSTLMGLIAAGYAGTDFIEGTFAKLVPQVFSSSAASNPPAAVAPTVETVQSLTSTIQTLSSHVIALAPPVTADLATPSSSAPGLETALRRVLPNLDVTLWLPALSAAFAQFNLNTPARMAAALGQFVAEAGTGFEDLRENMNYSAPRLMEVFPHKIPDRATADQYAGKPEAIANLVYANKLGNGDPATGDGYRFRGGGLLQLTGRAQYEALARSLGMDVEQAAAYVETAEGAALSGCWYLSSQGCLPLADQWRLTDLTRAVNGPAMLDLAKRSDYATRFRHALGAS